MKNNWIIIGVDGQACEYINGVLWNELKANNKVQFFEGFFKRSASNIKNNSIIERIKSKVKELKNVHYAYILNEKINLPFKGIWQRNFVLDEFDFEAFAKDDQQVCVLVMNSALSWLTKKNINKLNNLKKRHNLKLIHHSIDIREELAKKFKPLQAIKRQVDFDLFINYSLPTTRVLNSKGQVTFHLDSPYSKPNLEFEKSANSEFEQIDLLFTAGASKYRLDFASKIKAKMANFSKSSGIRTKAYFNISGTGTPEFKEKFSAVSDCEEWISLEANLELAKNSKCILEVLDLPAEYVSDRYHQAIVMNKKLLTNNPETKNLPLYNEKYMRIIGSPEELTDDDIKWIISNELVDYQYKDEFSPENFLTKIEAILDEK